MFEKMFEIEKEIANYNTMLKCGIYRITKNNQTIFTENKIASLKRELISEENRIRKLYF
jgi:hypothetical protein